MNGFLRHPSGRPWRGSRGRVLGLGGLGALWLLTRGRAEAASRGVLRGLTVVNEGLPFAGDGPSFATVSMRASRATARFDFQLARRAIVSLSILETGQGAASEQPSTVAETTLREQDLVASAGYRTLRWTPPASLPARTYIARVTARAAGHPAQTMHAVVRVLGVEAAFSTRSALPGDRCTLVVRTDAKTLTVQMLRSGPETEPTYANNEINGIPVGDPIQVDWRAHANAPAPLLVDIGANWPTGVYAARLDADDGRVGFAPIVVRPDRAPDTGRGGHPHEHLGRVQLLRRRPRRLGRHVVCPLEDHARRPDATARDEGRAVPLPQLRPRLPALAGADGEERRHLCRRGSRALHLSRSAAGRLRPDRVPRAHGVRDEAAVRPRPGATAISAATCCSCRRTTSSARSTAGTMS